MSSAFDNSIPLLTEVFQEKAAISAPARSVEDAGRRVEVEPARAPDAAVARLPDGGASRPALHGGEAAGAALEARAVDGWSDPEWDQLERRLAERVLNQLHSRVDFVLEQRLRDSMEAVLQRTLDNLTSEIGNGLRQTIEQVVQRAVAQEIAHLQTLKK
jgi:hypothetical protein